MQIRHTEDMGTAEVTGTCSVQKGPQRYDGDYSRGDDNIRLTLKDGRDNIPAGETVALTLDTDEQFIGFFDPSGLFVEEPKAPEVTDEHQAIADLSTDGDIDDEELREFRGQSEEEIDESMRTD